MLFWTSFQRSSTRYRGCAVVQICAMSVHEEVNLTYFLSCYSYSPYNTHTEHGGKGVTSSGPLFVGHITKPVAADS